MLIRRTWIISLILMSLICSINHTAIGADRRPRAHLVRAGETLGTVAHAYGFSYKYLACINDIRNPHLIRVNQKIMLPRPPAKAEQIKLIWPLKRGILTSKFGPRHNNCHDGIDIAAATKTPIYAAAKGRVIYSGTMRGYGNVVILNHNQMYNTVYAHNKINLVRKGQVVQQGDKIAAVGTSGYSTGPHLHFEIRANNVARNPVFYLPQPPKSINVPHVFLVRSERTNQVDDISPPQVDPTDRDRDNTYHG